MELLLARTTRTEESTIGLLSINGAFQCYTLEDVDRHITQGTHIDTIKERKVYGKTAIPSGRYEVAMTFSNRFKQYMPLLLNVPGFEGVRIHPGNKAADTEGCILLGETKAENFIGASKAAYSKFLTKLKAVEKTEKVFITIA